MNSNENESSERQRTSGGNSEPEGRRKYRSGDSTSGDRGRSGDRGQSSRSGNDASKVPALEVAVDHNIEKAIKVLKRRLIKEGLFKELKQRRYNEKPSERRKRKKKEAMKKLRKEEARNKKNASLF